MTTFVLTGFSLRFDDPVLSGDGSYFQNGTTMTIQRSDDTSFRFFELFTSKPGLPDVRFLSDLDFDIEVNDPDIGIVSVGPGQPIGQVGEITWTSIGSQFSATVIVIQAKYGIANYFVLEGDELPNFANLNAFNSFINAGSTTLAPLDNPSGSFIQYVSFENAPSVETTEDGIIGSSNNDTLTGDGDANTIKGLAGDDIIEGGAGADILDGGGNTVVGDIASYENSALGVTVTINGAASGGDAAGDTLLNFENLRGSTQNDTLTGDGGDNEIEGGSGGDTLDGGTHGAIGDTLSYASSAAGVTVYLASNTVSGGDATGDTISSFENVSGSEQVDFIFGDTGSNTIIGDGGADWLYGGDNADTLEGGAGADLMFGEGGADTMNGGVDGDFMWGGSEGDTMHGNDGIDWLRGEAGADMLFGDAGNDVLIGGTGNDEMWGGLDTDTFYGEADNDIINGEANGDVAFGQEGDDTINGGSEGDFLFGGIGSDTINGGTENDLMWGDMPGTGDGDEDIFVFDAGWGFDAVYDFELGIDEIRFGGVAGLTQFSDLTVFDGAANVTVVFGADAITLYGVTLLELNTNQADFIFS